MRIAVDGGALCAPEGHRYGTYRYSEELIRALRDYGSEEHAYTIYHFCDSDHAELASPRVIFKRVPSSGFLPFRIPLELALEPHEYFLALNQAIPPFYGGKVLVSSHGLSFLSCPDDYRSDYRRLRAQLERYVRRGDTILVSSERIGAELRQEYPELPLEILTLPFGVPDSFIRPLHRKRQPYVLYVGSGQPIKNLETLLRCFSEAREREGRKDIRFLLVGPSLDSLPERMPDGVELLPPAKLTELKSLYASASVYVSASRYESFNMPVIEAMSQGCPVVAMKSSLIPEQYPFANACENNEELIEGMVRGLRGDLPVPDAATVRDSFSWRAYVRALESLYN
jgi:glycosyltransferase involved in cell wall biosynthesis